jgi:uncharacterized protein YhfF
MFAVVVTVSITDFEKARKMLVEQIIEGVRKAPGLVSGYWLEPVDGKGMSVVVFDSEKAARDAIETFQLHPGAHPSEWVTVESSGVREVVASV